MEKISQNDDTWKHLFNGLDPLVVTFLPIVSASKSNQTSKELHLMFNTAKSEIKSMPFKPQIISHSIKLIQFWMLINMKTENPSTVDEKQFLQLLQISSTKEEFYQTSSLAHLLCQLYTPSEEHLDFHQAVDALLIKTNKPSKVTFKPFRINTILTIKSRILITLLGFISSLVGLYCFSSARFFI